MSDFVKLATTAIVQHKDKDGTILIGQRARDGLWEFAGGRIDPGETPAQCILRELDEELGIKAEINEDLGKFEGVWREMEMELYAFVVTWISGELKDHVHTNLKWVEPHEISPEDFIEEDWMILEKWLR